MVGKFSSIIDSLRARVSDTLGPDWNRLAYVYDVSKNDSRTIKQAYGVRGLGATEIDDLIGCNVSLEQDYEIILTNDYVTPQSDDNLEVEIKNLQDHAQDIYKVLVYDKWDTNIILVSGLSLDEPEILEEDNGVVQRFTVTIRYRVQLT